MPHEARKPDALFAAVWLLRYLAILTLHVTGNVGWLAVASALFFPVEAVGLWMDNGRRDLLSELWTWVLHTLSKHQRPLRGWNLLAAIGAIIEAMTMQRVLVHYGAPEEWVGAAAIALAALLHAHWLRPDIHG